MSIHGRAGLITRPLLTQGATMTEIETHELDVPGACIAYDVRGDLRSGETPLLLIGSPMDAAGFTTLATHFADRTVVTYDPRGAGRSVRTDATGESTPDDHASDLHHLVDALGAGPVDIFASSGGAVNGAASATFAEQRARQARHRAPLPRLRPRAGAGRADPGRGVAGPQRLVVLAVSGRRD
jgi:pimeloyl-ACP methyl ester carboxylesterase